MAKQPKSSDSPTVREAGRRGGLRTLQLYGYEHFTALGKKGQVAMRRRHPDMAKVWGRLGGRPRKPTLSEIEAAQSAKQTGSEASPSRSR